MFKKAAKVIGNKFVQEVKATLNQDISPAPGDFFTPTIQIGLEVGRGMGFVVGKVKTWSTAKKCIVCRSTPTCPDCKKCQEHCKCASEVVVTPEEWMCNHCGTPQPIDHRKCDSCGASRPFIK